MQVCLHVSVLHTIWVETRYPLVEPFIVHYSLHNEGRYYSQTSQPTLFYQIFYSLPQSPVTLPHSPLC
ncbi:hypothetical protein XENTR_v10006492 [Xenopus tropicalis]|nr:hypothetical protein XENTR_v10006492 [Xenopus tropicalis]